LSAKQSIQKVGGTMIATKIWQNIDLQRILKTGRLSEKQLKIQEGPSLILKFEKLPIKSMGLGNL